MAKIKLPLGTIPLPMPVGVISVGDNENSNLITLAWLGRVVSEPPVISISIRPSRFSYKMIEKNGEFVVNLPSIEQLHAMDYCGTRSGKNTDKWKVLGLTPMPADHVKPPMITEFPWNFECKVVNKLTIGSHTIFFGEVLAVHVDESFIKDQKPDPEMQNQIIYIAGFYYGLNIKPKEKQGFSVKN